MEHKVFVLICFSVSKVKKQIGLPWNFAAGMLHLCANSIKLFVSRAIGIPQKCFPQTFEQNC